MSAEARRKNIFIIDDNITNLTMSSLALDELYQVFTFNTGEGALRMLGKLLPDLILLDIQMPEMNGYDVIKQIKANPHTAHIPVIFLTSLDDEGSEMEGLSLGAVDFINKPFSAPLLHKRIEIHLLMEAQKRELVNYSTNLETLVDEKSKSVVQLKNVILKTLAEIVDCRDKITGGHVERVQLYIRALIRAMKRQGVYAVEIEAIDEELAVQSSALHDVGKIYIKDELLFSTKRYTLAEFDEMKKHTTHGENIINRIKKNAQDSDFLEYAGIFALTHHEKWDGSGYPNELKGTEIPLLGRIIAIAYVYDALISVRPYKAAYLHVDAAAHIINERGRHFDPLLVDLFENIDDEFERIGQINS